MGPLMLGLTGLSALGTGLMAMPLADGSYGRNMRESILQGGPDTPEGDFNTSWWENLFIDEDSLGAQYKKRQYKSALEGPQGSTIMEIQRLTGKPFEEGMNAQTYINQNLGAYKDLAGKENINNQIELRTRLNEVEGNSPQMKLLQQQLKDQSELTRAQLAANNNQFGLQFAELQQQNRNNYQLRQDQAKNNYRVNMRSLDNDVLKLGIMKQEQANKMTMHQRELDVHRQGKREDLLAALGTGLTALGAAFVM